GLPSGFLGAGAERSGLPSFVRGVPLAGMLNHCPAAGTLAMTKIATTELVLRFIATSWMGSLLAHAGNGQLGGSDAMDATPQAPSIARATRIAPVRSQYIDV